LCFYVANQGFGTTIVVEIDPWEKFQEVETKNVVKPNAIDWDR